MICELCGCESGHLTIVDGEEMHTCDECGAVMFVYDDGLYEGDIVIHAPYDDDEDES